VLVRPLLACALLVGAVLARGAAADETALVFVVGHSVGTVSVVADQVVLSAMGGQPTVGRLRALVIDARLAPTGWALSVSATCGTLWLSPATDAPPDVRVSSRRASLVEKNVTDVDSVVTLTSAGQTGTYLCPLTQTVS
jgi:hypothetical protein